jgi:hypothetical protein
LLEEMAKDRFELSPEKPNSVRAFTLEGTIELETPDNRSARALLDVLNSFVSDIVIDTQSRLMETPEPVSDRRSFAPLVWLVLVALALIGVVAFWLSM